MKTNFDKSRDDAISKLRQISDYRNMFAAGVGEVTDRSQIIDPYAIDPSLFGFSRAGKARYQQFLNQAITYAQQQEAAYKEWYESPEQQAIRERQAGLNPDIIGLDDAEAGSVSYDQPSPLDGIRTNEQILFDSVSSFSQLIGSLSSVANLATAFTSIPGIRQANKNLITEGDLLNAQLVGQNLANEAVDIGNIASLSLGISNDIANLFGAAKLADPDLDVDAWFSDDSNFTTLESIYGKNPRYKSVLAQSRKAVLDYQKSVNADLADQAQSNFDFAKVINSPLYSDDQKIMAAQLGPFMELMIAQEVMDMEFNKALDEWMIERQSYLDAESDAARINAINGYEADYYSELDPHMAAGNVNMTNAENIIYLDSVDSAFRGKVENFVNRVLYNAKNLEYQINKNYAAQYRADPNGYGGWKAAYLFSTNGGASWSDYYLANTRAKFEQQLNAIISEYEASTGRQQAQPYIESISSVLHMIGLLFAGRGRVPISRGPVKPIKL